MIVISPSKLAAAFRCPCVVLCLAALSLSGCGREPITRVRLDEPRIVLHMQERYETVVAHLSYEGIEPVAETGCVYRGTGVLRLFDNVITVCGDHIEINDVTVESSPNGYRNLILDRRGRVRKDRFLPFE